MKIAAKAPTEFRSPVRVTDDCYEMWYTVPVNLGRIHRRPDRMWYTADGMRFVSSRDALDYLIRMREAGNTVTAPEKRAVVIEAAPVPPRALTSSRPNVAVSRSRRSTDQLTSGPGAGDKFHELLALYLQQLPDATRKELLHNKK